MTEQNDEEELLGKRDWLSTFIHEDENAQHFMGSHWDPFFNDGYDDLLLRLSV